MPTSITQSAPFVVNGCQLTTGSLTLKAGAYTGIRTKSAPAFIRSVTGEENSSIPLHSRAGYEPRAIYDSIRMYLSGPHSLNVTAPLKAEGVEDIVNSSVPLHTFSARGSRSKTTTLFVCGFTGDSSGSIPLHTDGCTWLTTASHPLFIKAYEGLYGNLSVNSYITQYIHGQDNYNANIPLVIFGSEIVNEDLPLYIYGQTIINTWAPLLALAHLDSDGNIPLFTQAYGLSAEGIPLRVGYPSGAEAPITKKLPLVMAAPPGVDSTQGIPLYLYNDENHLDINATLDLLMTGSGVPLHTSLPMFLTQEALTGTLPFNITGKGIWTGYIPSDGNIPLYMARENEVGVIPLVCQAPQHLLNTYIPLQVTSVIPLNENIPLVLPSVIYNEINSYITLVVESGVAKLADIPLVIPTPYIAVNATIPINITGCLVNLGDIPLAMPGTYALINASLPLISCHVGGSPNSYVTLYIHGVYLNNGNIPLVFPTTYGILSGSKKLIVQGY